VGAFACAPSKIIRSREAGVPIIPQNPYIRSYTGDKLEAGVHGSVVDDKDLATLGILEQGLHAVFQKLARVPVYNHD
jgi:hypothetical protein